jgi:integrase
VLLLGATHIRIPNIYILSKFVARGIRIMPRYKKKITSQMEYEEFKEKIHSLPIAKQAFLSVLFFAGVRVSEALALTPDDINCTQDTIYIQFFRLKGSKQTDPLPLPRKDALHYLCGLENDPFPWCRKTGYNIVKSVFPALYPHYFRQNRFTTVAENYGLATMINFSGLAPTSVSHYIAKVDIKKVGKALLEEIKETQ